MEHESAVERHLTGSPWLCLAYTSAPASVEAQFFADHTGVTMYERFGPGRYLPDIFDVEWQWRWNEAIPNLLTIAWSDDVIAQIEFEVVNESFTFSRWDGKPGRPFTSKLTLSAHLFPLGGDFPDGWIREYFGYQQEDKL
jgi:hypothetical protein